MTTALDTDDESPALVACKHFCSFGCGNEYEFIVVTASDSTTQFLCVPCFIGTAADLLTAVTDPDDPAVMLAVETYAADTVTPAGTRGRKKALVSGIEPDANAGVFDDFEPDISAA